MKVTKNMGIGGQVSAYLVNADGSGREEVTGPGKNMVLDQAFPALHTEGLPLIALFMSCAVGTGTTAPVASDTGLEAELTRTSQLFTDGNLSTCGGQKDETVTPKEVVYRKTFEFPVGTFSGESLTEVGFSHLDVAGNNLNIRALFKDDTGTATAVIVPSDKALRVVYDFTVQVEPTNEVATSFGITNIGTVNATHRAGLSSNTGRFDGSLAGLGTSGRIDTSRTSANHIEGYTAFATALANNAGTEYCDGVPHLEPAMPHLLIYMASIPEAEGSSLTFSEHNYLLENLGTTGSTSLGRVWGYGVGVSFDPATLTYSKQVTIPATKGNSATLNFIAIGGGVTQDYYAYSGLSDSDDNARAIQYAVLLDDGSAISKANTHELTLTFDIQLARL